MLISNIQRFCLKDGEGIRTTIFFMGCPLRCFWCSNPENLSCNIVQYQQNGIEKTFGRYYTDDELFVEIIKDKEYFYGGGGVTFSGGECLLFLKDHIELLKKLQENKISICVETCLNVPQKNLLDVIDYIDEYFIDLKVFTSKAEQIKCAPKDILRNLDLLKHKNSIITFRIPLVKNFNDDNENLTIIKNIIHEFKPKNVEIFPVINLGKEKYKSMGLAEPILEKMTEIELETIKNFLDYPNLIINKF